MRPLSIGHKIILNHTSDKKFKVGDFVFVKVDLTLANDVTAPLSIKEFEKLKIKKVFNPQKIVLIPDHFTPAKDIKSAQNVKIMKEFSQKYKIRHFYPPGRCGIEHVFLPEQGFVKPGSLIIGADSHTCTYGALGSLAFGVGSTDIAFTWAEGKIWIRVPEVILFIYRGKLKKFVTSKDIILYTISKIGCDGANFKIMEFAGPLIEKMSQDQRFTLCNMAIEAGGFSGIINPDKITFDYLKKRVKKLNFSELMKIRSDVDAQYSQIYDWDLTELEVLVAAPHLPSNVKPVYQLRHVNVDQVVIGSCTNGRIEDLRMAAKILKSKKVNSRTRLLIFPGSPQVLLEAQREGLIDIFLKCGAILCPPTCGPCLGGHLGVLAKGEVCISTTNRNFIGRMGDPDSQVYLSNPYVAAASSIKGRITHPQEVL